MFPKYAPWAPPSPSRYFGCLVLPAPSNYNTCIFGDGMPITLKFVDAVGEILTAGPIKDVPPLFRFNNRQKPMDDYARFEKVLGQVAHKRLTYKELTGKEGETKPEAF